VILVTGGSGVLGRALVRRLEADGETVRVLSSRDGDLRDRDYVLDAFSTLRPRLLYHLAAKVHGLGGNTTFPGEMFADNVRINLNVIDGARLAGCEKIVAASTVATYSSDAPKPVREDAIWDGPPHGSELAYGHAKRAMLAQLEAYARQYGTRFAYPILTNIYGPDDRFDPVYGHVVPSLVAKFHAAAASGGAVQVWGTGRAERDFIYADDAAGALVEIAASVDGPINVATGTIVPIRAIVDALSEISGVRDVVWDSSKPDGQLERSYDVSKLRDLGFVPKTAIEDGLRKTFEWYSAHYPEVRS
jgi:GDP-L-fucose synthase